MSVCLCPIEILSCDTGCVIKHFRSLLQCVATSGLFYMPFDPRYCWHCEPHGALVNKNDICHPPGENGGKFIYDNLIIKIYKAVVSYVYSRSTNSDFDIVFFSHPFGCLSADHSFIDKIVFIFWIYSCNLCDWWISYCPIIVNNGMKVWWIFDIVMNQLYRTFLLFSICELPFYFRSTP